MRKLLLLLCMMHYALCIGAAEVKSPNGNIELKFSVDATGRPLYEMTYKDKPVIMLDILGITMKSYTI